MWCQIDASIARNAHFDGRVGSPAGVLRRYRPLVFPMLAGDIPKHAVMAHGGENATGGHQGLGGHWWPVGDHPHVQAEKKVPCYKFLHLGWLFGTPVNRIG